MTSEGEACTFVAAARVGVRLMKFSPHPSRRAFGPPQDEGGGGAPKSAKSYGSASVARCGGRLSARQSRTFAAPGPALVRSIALEVALTDPSAGSRRDLLLGPEGAPMPPGCLVATRPAGAAPRPAFATRRETPLQKDEVGGVYGRICWWGITHREFVIPA